MTDAFHKRLKRHVIGRQRDYFAIAAPGLETLCFRELQAICPEYARPEITAGGVLFRGRLDDCMRANLLLRTANRILMRLATLRATHFTRLHKQISRIPWELYLKPGSGIRVSVTTHHCRLHHTAAIAERLTAGIQACLGAPAGDSALPEQRLYVRGVDDRFSVSLDSSGDLLYRRGLKSHSASAPLRETTAAAALMLARFATTETLLDPMCGSGTFALEGAMQIAGIPPGWFRAFGFFNWPAFIPERWDYLRQQHRPLSAVDQIGGVIASDSDPDACRTLQDCIQRFDLGSIVTVAKGDFFDLDPESFGRPPGLLTINPPYGRRLNSRQQSKRMVGQIVRKLRADFRNWRFVLITPHRFQLKSIPFRFKVRRLLHGGLKIYLVYGRIA